MEKNEESAGRILKTVGISWFSRFAVIIPQGYPFAALLIANNQDIRSVPARLGHAETSTTLNIYTHFLESTDKKSADILENVLVKHA